MQYTSEPHWSFMLKLFTSKAQYMQTNVKKTMTTTTKIPTTVRKIIIIINNSNNYYIVVNKIMFQNIAKKCGMDTLTQPYLKILTN